MLMGPPGVGKTAMMAWIAQSLKLKPVQLIAREYESFELSGVIDVNDGVLKRHLIGPAQLVSSEPCLLMLDEATACDGPIFAQVSKIAHERKFGDTPFHPQSLVMMAANPQNQSLSANDMPLPLINRLRIFFMEPTIKEIQGFFRTQLGEPDSDLRNAGEVFAACLDAKPDLVQVQPPKPEDCASENMNWASPRSWERALRTYARAQPLKPKLLKASMIGDLGPFVADAFLAIIATFGKLPSISEIVADPKRAKLPKDFLQGVGVLSLLPSICRVDPCAAWVYCARIDEATFQGGAETKIALSSALMRVAGASDEQINASEHGEDMRKARVTLGVATTKARGKV
jgi:hypothetical protein